MRPRVHHFRKSDAKILRTFSIQSETCGHIAGVSNIIRDFIDGIKAGKPLKVRYYLHQEYPCSLHGKAENFDITQDAPDGNFGTIRTIQTAQDEENKFYLRFETEKDFYLIPIR